MRLAEMKSEEKRIQEERIREEAAARATVCFLSIKKIFSNSIVDQMFSHFQASVITLDGRAGGDGIPK